MAYSDGDCMLIACVWFRVAILDGILGFGLADMTSECVFHYGPSLGTLAVSHHFGRAP